LAPIALATLLLAGCGEENVYKPPPPPKVTVAKPVQREVTDYVDFTGRTGAVH